MLTPARTLSTRGKGFWLAMARGMLAPPSTTDPARASSRPQSAFLWSRYAALPNRAPVRRPPAREGTDLRRLDNQWKRQRLVLVRWIELEIPDLYWLYLRKASNSAKGAKHRHCHSRMFLFIKGQHYDSSWICAYFEMNPTYHFEGFEKGFESRVWSMYWLQRKKYQWTITWLVTMCNYLINIT